MKLSKEEKSLLDSVEKGEWKSVQGVKGKIKKYHAYAKATFRKDKGQESKYQDVSEGPC